MKVNLEFLLGDLNLIPVSVAQRLYEEMKVYMYCKAGQVICLRDEGVK